MKTILLAFIFSVSASASTLKEAFDEYQYKVTVEWDQHDREFLEQAGDDFRTAVAVHSPSDLRAFVSEQLPDLDLKLFRNLSPEAALELVKKSYVQGSSWSGSANALYWLSAATILVNVILLLQNYGVLDSL